MSGLDPKTKEDLRKQIEEIASGKGEIGVGGKASINVDTKLEKKEETTKEESQEQITPKVMPVQTETEKAEEPVVDNESETYPLASHPIVGEPEVSETPEEELVEEMPEEIVQEPEVQHEEMVEETPEVAQEPEVQHEKIVEQIPESTETEASGTDSIVSPKESEVQTEVSPPMTQQPMQQPMQQMPPANTVAPMPPVQQMPPMVQQPIMQQPPVMQQPMVTPMPPQSAPVQEKKNEDTKVDPTIFIAIIVIMVMVGVIFLMTRLGSGSSQASQQQYPVHPLNQQMPMQPQMNPQNGPFEFMPNEFEHHRHDNPYPYPYPQSMSIGDIKRYLEPWIDNKISAVSSRVDKLDHRTWLLAIANNENAVASRKLAERVGARDLSNKYLSFDRNWKLNKMPEFIRLTHNQRYELLNGVDDSNYLRRYDLEYDYHTHSYQNNRYLRPQGYNMYQNGYTYPDYTYPNSSVQPRVIYQSGTGSYSCYNGSCGLNGCNSCSTSGYSSSSCYNGNCGTSYSCRPGRVFNWNYCR